MSRYPPYGKLTSHPALMDPDQEVETEVMIEMGTLDRWFDGEQPMDVEVIAGVVATMTCWKNGYRPVGVRSIDDNPKGVTVEVTVTGW